MPDQSAEGAIESQLSEMLPELTRLRRDVHAHPEPGFRERRTANLVIAWLESLPHMTLRTGLAGGTGVVATLGEGKPGPCLALRADMDALEVPDECGQPHASTVPGVAHVCGHDGHVACLLGAARLLARNPEGLGGPVRFLFQPAEEGGAGARRMCEDGALENPRPRMIFALHCWPFLPVGTIGVRAGAVMASTDAVNIEIRGQSCHAATPQKGVDAVLAASHVVVALQSAVARRTDPIEPGVVTIGSIHGGSVRNAIAANVILRGTIRAISAAKREQLRQAVREIAVQTARAFGAVAEVDLVPGYPVTVNDEHAAACVLRAGRRALGEDRVIAALPVSMGGEDFAFYQQVVPGAFWRLGTGREDGTPVVPLHSSAFDFPDEALPIGVRMHCALAREFSACYPGR
ncbi:MAG: amidohydrolase [Lentisphaeria bacterium]|nr:amidohydrolase [Lentisphaeria bacterium]